MSDRLSPLMFLCLFSIFTFPAYCQDFKNRSIERLEYDLLIKTEQYHENASLKTDIQLILKELKNRNWESQITRRAKKKLTMTNNPVHTPIGMGEVKRELASNILAARFTNARKIIESNAFTDNNQWANLVSICSQIHTGRDTLSMDELLSNYHYITTNRLLDAGILSLASNHYRRLLDIKSELNPKTKNQIKTNLLYFYRTTFREISTNFLDLSDKEFKFTSLMRELANCYFSILSDSPADFKSITNKVWLHFSIGTTMSILAKDLDNLSDTRLDVKITCASFDTEKPEYAHKNYENLLTKMNSFFSDTNNISKNTFIRDIARKKIGQKGRVAVDKRIKEYWHSPDVKINDDAKAEILNDLIETTNYYKIVIFGEVQ